MGTAAITIVLALLAALVGAVAGGMVGFFGVILIGTMAGQDTPDGGLAMGAAVGGLPLGAVLGALLGAVLVVRARHTGATPDKGEPEVPTAASPKPERRVSRRGWVAIALVFALTAGAWRVIFYEPPPPLINRAGSTIYLDSEVRLPAKMVDLDALTAMQTVISTWGGDNLTGQWPPVHKVDGDHLVLGMRHRLIYRTSERTLYFYLRDGLVAFFDLPLGEIPAPTDEFSDWRPVSRVRAHYYGDDLPGSFDISIRTQVTDRGR